MYSTVILVKFRETSVFRKDFRKKHTHVIFHENLSVGAKLFCADGQTDMTKLIITLKCVIPVVRVN